MWSTSTDEDTLSPAENEKLTKIAGPALTDYFSLAVLIEQVHAEQYLGENCPVCRKFAPLCACPHFNESLHENEAGELKAESDALWDAFFAARSEP